VSGANVRSAGAWTAILLAGQRPGEDAFAQAYGVSAKALIPVGGEPMLGRVARTLLECPSVGRILILAQEPEALMEGELAWLAAEPRVSTARAAPGISTSIAAVAGGPRAPYPVLIATADHPLLRPEMVEHFIAASEGLDIGFALVERQVVERVHVTRRTWIKFQDGHFTGANLFALVTPASAKGVGFWARVERDRKKVLRLLLFFGPTIFLRAFTRTISHHAAVAKAGRNIGLRLRAVLLPFAEAAIDVDKPADLELAERILAARVESGESDPPGPPRA
jgi:CTP:molybdopterin cytidylyltransferase MocA